MTASTERHSPTTIAEACQIVRKARDAGMQIVTVGGGTKSDWTSPPTRACIELDLRGLSRVVEYSPEDMTITIEAGITLKALLDRLSERNQRLTLDPPGAAQATIGGIIASNDSGPVRLAYGTAKDIVIGMSVIDPDGEIVKSGGKVVKNVAGYDLHRLHIGSFGTLGPIVSVTFRLRPLPEARGLVVLQPRDADDAERMIAEALAGETRPTMIEMLNAKAARSLELDPRLTVIIGFEENADVVRWQCERIVRTIGGTALSEADSLSLYGRIREAAGADVATSFKATMPSSQVAGFVRSCDTATAGEVRLVARAGNGIVYGLLDGDVAVSAWDDLQVTIATAKGSLHIRGTVPPGVRRFGAARGDAWLSASVRKAFDPTGLFAPERIEG